MTLKQLVYEHRSEILAIARRHGAADIRLFGSAVRGAERPESDLDFLVQMERGRSLLDLGGQLMDLQQLLGRHVDVVTAAGLQPERRDEVLQESLPV